MGRFITKISFIYIEQIKSESYFVNLLLKSKAYIIMNSISINFHSHQKQRDLEKSFMKIGSYYQPIVINLLDGTQYVDLDWMS